MKPFIFNVFSLFCTLFSPFSELQASDALISTPHYITQSILAKNESSWIKEVLSTTSFQLPTRLLVELNKFDRITEELGKNSISECLMVRKTGSLSSHSILVINRWCIDHEVQQNKWIIPVKKDLNIEIAPLSYLFLNFLTRLWIRNSGKEVVEATQFLIKKNLYFIFSDDSLKIKINFLEPERKLMESFWLHTFLIISTLKHYPKQLIDYPDFIDFIASFLLSPHTQKVEIQARINEFNLKHNRLAKFDQGQALLISENRDAWAIKIKLLEQAKHKIIISSYIFGTDIFSQAILAVLYKKASEGVAVYLMVDYRGSPYLCGLIFNCPQLKFLSWAGAHVALYNPHHMQNPLGILVANHKKIMMVDDEYLVTGGRNIDYEYFVSPQDTHLAINDFEVLVKSRQAAKDSEIAFGEEFFSSSAQQIKFEGSREDFQKSNLFKDSLNRAKQAYEGLKKISNEGKTPSDLKVDFPETSSLKTLLNLGPQFEIDPLLKSTPVKFVSKNTKFGNRKDLLDVVLFLIQSSKNNLIIETPYLVLSQPFLTALKNAANRGVKIIIHTNSSVSTDSSTAQVVFNHEWKDILSQIPNIEIYVSEGPWLEHGKVMLVDNEMLLISSFNFDPVSAYKNAENGLLIRSSEFYQQFYALFSEKISKSEKLDANKSYETDLLKKSPIRYWFLDKIRSHL